MLIQNSALTTRKNGSALVLRPAADSRNPSLPSNVQQELNRYFGSILASYEWFSEENYNSARDCLAAFATIVGRGEPNPQVHFFEEAIVDLLHNDRAKRASSLVKDTLPVREIPRQIIKGHEIYGLNLQPLTGWKLQIPYYSCLFNLAARRQTCR